MEVGEFYDHVTLSQHRSAQASFEMLGVIGAVMDKKVRQAVVANLRQILTLGCEKIDIYEGLDDASRLRAIGSIMQVPGWEQYNQVHIEWMEDHGFTEYDALAAYNQRMREVDSAQPVPLEEFLGLST